MILVSQTYTPESEQRAAELLRCKLFNERSGIFNIVEYLDGTERRLSFCDLLRHCLDRYRGKFCVVSNSDIMFGSSAYSLGSLKKPNRVVSLTRWESSSGPRFIGYVHQDRFFSGSQDAWGFIAGEIPIPEVEIPLGVVGCDSIIGGWAAASGVELVNPSLSIRTTHVHSSPRERSPGEGAIGGFYGYPEMTSLNTTGDVLCHHWPSPDGTYEFNWQLLHTRT